MANAIVRMDSGQEYDVIAPEYASFMAQLKYCIQEDDPMITCAVFQFEMPHNMRKGRDPWAITLIVPKIESVRMVGSA